MKAMVGLNQQIARSSLATVAVCREPPYFNDRERAASKWAESVTRVAA